MLKSYNEKYFDDMEVYIIQQFITQYPSTTTRVEMFMNGKFDLFWRDKENEYARLHPYKPPKN